MVRDDPLHERLAAHLASELRNSDVARELASAIMQDALSWHAPEFAPERMRAIFAFTFGNRMLPNGNRVAGPVNERLAECALRLHRGSGAAVYAQWEIAELLHGRIAEDALTPIFPGRDPRGEPVYLGTGAVIADIAARVGDPASIGPVGVVAFADHLYRAVAGARQAGFNAWAPVGMAMPAEYDADSGQAWCRSRLAYLLHDIMLRVADRRAGLVGAGWG